MVLEISAKAFVHIKGKCEYCGTLFDYSHGVRGSTCDNVDKAKESAKESAHFRVRERNFRYKKCPHCSYIQSWMRKGYRSAITDWVIFTGIIIILPVRIALEHLLSAANGDLWLLALVISIVCPSLVLMPLCIEPNLFWLRKHKRPSPSDGPLKVEHAGVEIDSAVEKEYY